MRYLRDTNSGTVYIYLRHDREVASRDRMPDGALVDLDGDGEPIGVELAVTGLAETWDPAAFIAKYPICEADAWTLRHLVERHQAGTSTLDHTQEDLEWRSV